MKISKKLAIFGGNKTLSKKTNHFSWPPKSNRAKMKFMNDFLKKDQLNSKGFPIVVEKFEKRFSKLVGAKFALSTNSGTSALHSAFYALDIKKKDEVVVPSLTFHATGTPLLKFTKNIKFCGCDEIGNIDIEDLKKKITKKTKLVVITHLGGHPCEMDEIMDLKKKYKFKLIEDCSHAHESTYKNRKVGTFGEINIFSMDRNKLLSVGEGGVLVTNNRDLFEKCLLISDFGLRLKSELKLKKNKKYIETGFGFKHRIHPMAAAAALYEMTKLKYYIKLRHKRLNFITKKLKKINGLEPPITKDYVNRGAFYSYRIKFKKEYFKNINFNFFITALQKEGLQVRKAGNPPLETLPYFKICKPKNIKSSKIFYNTTFSIPTFTFEDMKLINLYIKGFQKVCKYFYKKS